MSSLVGAHIDSDLDNLIKSAEVIKNNGGSIIQIFVNKFSKKADNKYQEFTTYLKTSGLKCVVHSSYTINLAQNWDLHSWWLKQFILEIKTAHKIGAFGVVIHMGKQLNMDKSIAINNMYTALEYVLNKTQQYNIKIFLETSSGQGSEMFYNLDELSEFLKKIFKLEQYKNKLGICIDTCHIFSAGYDVRGKKNIIKFFEHFDKIIGIDKIKLVHLNDSKNELGAKIDRHANYESGNIGKSSIILLANFFKNLGVPIILETPVENISNDMNKLI